MEFHFSNKFFMWTYNLGIEDIKHLYFLFTFKLSIICHDVIESINFFFYAEQNIYLKNLALTRPIYFQTVYFWLIFEL